MSNTLSNPAAWPVIGTAYPFHRLWRGLAGWRERHRTVRELSSLSNESLRDIGLSRSDIALNAFNRPGHLRPDNCL